MESTWFHGILTVFSLSTPRTSDDAVGLGAFKDWGTEDKKDEGPHGVGTALGGRAGEAASGVREELSGPPFC